MSIGRIATYGRHDVYIQVTETSGCPALRASCSCPSLNNWELSQFCMITLLGYFGPHVSPDPLNFFALSD